MTSPGLATVIFAYLLIITAPSGRATMVVERVEGVVGGDLTLPCDVIPPIDDRVAVILWYRDNHPDAMYTYDARNTSLGFRKHTPRDQTTARRTRFHPQHPARMVISGASLQDAGRYECRVDFMRAPSKTTYIEVSVMEPPSAIQVSRHTGQVVAFTVTADEGDQLRLSCVVTGGNPRPRVWWTLRNKTHEFVVDETYEPITGDKTQNDLLLPRLTPHHHFKHLTCHASNTNATAPLSSSLTLLLNLAPQRVRITGLGSPLVSGQRYRVGCETYGSRPAPTLTWTIKRRERLEEVLATEDLAKRNVSRSYLELEVSWADHRAILRCSAFSPNLKERIVTNSSIFDVQYKPRLQLRLGRTLQPDMIKEGMDVYFHCSVSANPKVYKISWYHNGEEVRNNPSAGVLVSDDHLVMQKIKRRWSGAYVCKASNVVGDSASDTLNLPVQFAPICGSAVNTVYHAALGEEIELACHVLSHPPNVTFSWTFMNTLTEHERVAGDRVTWKGLVSWLKYLPEKTQDYGTLHCWASNLVGHQQKPCIFTVKPAGVPSPPFNCTVSNQTWESVEVTCGDPRAALGHHHHHHHSGHHGYDTSHHGYESGHYESGQQGDVYETNEVLQATPGYPAELLQDSDKPRYLVTVQERVSCAVTHNVTGERGKFSVTGLTPGLDYVISVARYNSHGRSSNVTLEAFTLRTAENRMREEIDGSGSALLGVVLGVLAVVLLLALAAIVVTLRYRGRSSSASSASSSTLRHGSPSVKTQLPSGGEGSESGGGLDHPDLLEAEAHVPSSVVAPYRSPGTAAEVTQALLPPPATRNLQQEEEVGTTPSSVSPTTVHLDYLSACESGPDPITASSSVRAHPHLYVRAESHLAGQQESFL